jgi:fermentation-respiration switch protein FrsA (DUF1100 family)
VSANPWKAVRILFQHVLPRLALIYVVVACSIFHMNCGLVFYPDRELEGHPGKIGLAYQDVTIPTADGLKLHAWYVPAERPIGTVLHCHGNAGNISHRLDIIDLFHGLGVNVLIFDYRGYGHSEGKPNEQGTYLDAETAWKYLLEQRHERPERIVIHGQSLGGSVAAYLARDHRPAGLVLESTFHDITELGAELFPLLPVRWISWLKYKTADYVRAVKCPVMVIHSRQDEMIAFHHGQKVFAAAAEPKRFLEIHGSHNDGPYESRAVYEPAMRKFLDDALGKQPATAEPVPAGR